MPAYQYKYSEHIHIIQRYCNSYESHRILRHPLNCAMLVRCCNQVNKQRIKRREIVMEHHVVQPSKL